MDANLMAMYTHKIQPPQAVARFQALEPAPLVDYAKPLNDVEMAARRCYNALEEDKDLDQAEREIRTMIGSARDVLQYIKTQRERKSNGTS
jgi:chemotaxis regulatin CheY-phosphate phosphatase CheZ